MVSGSSRGAILGVIAFFAVGAAVLALVDVEEGQREAHAEDREALMQAKAATRVSTSL